MKYATLIGITIGFFLAVGALLHGFSGFLLVLVLCGVGGAVGAQLEGLVDFRNIANNNLTGRGRGRGRG